MVNSKFKKTVLLVDADYLDTVTCQIIIHFEKQIERPLGQARLDRWLECATLDGGVRKADDGVQAIFVHSKKKRYFEYIDPMDFKDEIDGMSFMSKIGEFEMSCIPVEDIAPAEGFMRQAAEMLCDAKEVENLIVVAALDLSPDIAPLLDKSDKNITVLDMKPTEGLKHRQVILGFSIMQALRIKSEEIK